MNRQGQRGRRREVDPERAAQRVEQPIAERIGVQALVRRRLAYEVDGAQLEGAQGEVIAVRLAGGGQHNDGPRRLAHDVAEHLQAVESRHDDVERHEVRAQRMDLPDRVETVLGLAGDEKLATRLEQVDQYAPDESTVVDHQDRPALRAHDFRRPGIALSWRPWPR